VENDVKLTVTRNTYPQWNNVPHACMGDVVRWSAGKRSHVLVRDTDGKTVFSRDCLPKDQDDNRPMIGVIAMVKSKGWFLEIQSTPPVKDVDRGK